MLDLKTGSVFVLAAATTALIADRCSTNQHLETIQDLQAQLHQLQTKVELMKEFHGHAQESLELETSNRKTESKINMIRVTQLVNEAVQKQLVAEKASIASLQQTVNTQDKDLDDENSRIEGLYKGDTTQDAEIKASRITINDIQSRIQNQDVEIKANGAANNNLQSGVKGLETESNQNLKNHEAEATIVAADHKVWYADYSSDHATIEDLSQGLKSAQASIKALEAQVTRNAVGHAADVQAISGATKMEHEVAANLASIKSLQADQSGDVYDMNIFKSLIAQNQAGHAANVKAISGLPKMEHNVSADSSDIRTLKAQVAKNTAGHAANVKAITGVPAMAAMVKADHSNIKSLQAASAKNWQGHEANVKAMSGNAAEARQVAGNSANIKTLKALTAKDWQEHEDDVKAIAGNAAKDTQIKSNEASIDQLQQSDKTQDEDLDNDDSRIEELQKGDTAQVVDIKANRATIKNLDHGVKSSDAEIKANRDTINNLDHGIKALDTESNTNLKNHEAEASEVTTDDNTSQADYQSNHVAIEHLEKEQKTVIAGLKALNNEQRQELKNHEAEVKSEEKENKILQA